MSSPRRRRDDGCGRGGRRGLEAEAPALDLLDERWFFSNTLGKNWRAARPPPPQLPRAPWTSGKCDGAPEGASRMYESGCRRLLRTPSLPSPRVGMEALPKEEGIAASEVEDDDLNWSSIYEGVLRTRIAEGRGGGGGRSALHRAPSMPVPSSATANDGCGEEAPATRSTPCMPRLRHSHSTLGRHCRSHTPTKVDRTARASSGSGGGGSAPRRELLSFSASQQPAMARCKSEFQDKKWKSSSDLESIEVQGFKDLGFVFDEEELRESLADVLPGLRGKPAKAPSGSHSGSGSDNDSSNSAVQAAGGGGSAVQRPYLSEAWHHARRPSSPAAAAAIRLRQADARSAAEVKDQIRMWAQAVACNVRQEC